MSAKIRANESYMDCVFNSIFENLNQGIKRREENSIWGPVELPVRNSHDYDERIPSKIFKDELVNEQAAKNLKNDRLIPKVNIINHDSTEKYSSKISESKNVSNKGSSVVTERKIMNTCNEDIKQITTCLHDEKSQNSEVDNISEAQNLKTCKITADYFVESSITSFLENNSSNSRHLSDEQSGNGKESAVIKGKSVENANFNHSRVVISNKIPANINDSPVQLNKKLSHFVDKEKYHGIEFDQWCINRKLSYRSRSNLSLSDSSTSAGNNHDVQHLSSPTKNECEMSVPKDTCLLKNKPHHDIDDCKVDRKYFHKTNLSGEKPASDYQSSNLTNIEMPKSERFEFNDCIKNQKVPNFADKISKDKDILENDLPCSLEVSHDKMNTIDIKVQHADDYNSEIKVAQDVFSIKQDNCIDKRFYQKESSKPAEHISESYDSSKLKKSNRRRRRSRTLPPRFRNDVKINATDSKKQYVDDDSNPETKVGKDLFSTEQSVCITKKFDQKESNKPVKLIAEANDSSKLKRQRKSSNCNELPPRFRSNENIKSNIEVENQCVSKNINLKSKLCNENSKERTNQKKKPTSFSHSSQNTPSSKTNHLSCVREKTQLCIKITDEKCDKDFEFMVDSFAISRIKKTLPKLSADLPDIDSSCKEMHYSADALSIVLKFVFCRSFKFVMPSIATGVEVLAAAYSWHIADFFKLFQDKFLNKLTSENAKQIFFYAYHYNLKEICDACKLFLPDNADLENIIPRKKQKMCVVSISTFIEPSEISIPFEPIETDISLSFKKQIDNIFTFKPISGSYSVTGFQIQLNEEYLIQKEGNKNMLEINYSVKKVNGCLEIEGTERKPLRAINIIYFKKTLVLNPEEVGEIFIQTEIEPYLCSAHKERKIKIKNSDGELNLMMESNRKVQNPDRKLFLVGKFFYNVNRNL